jgi:hypothetical protein
MGAPTVTLNNGVQMPVLGFSVYQIPPSRPSRPSPTPGRTWHRGA